MPARRHGADQLEVAADRCDELAEVAEVAELMGDDVDTDGDATGLPEIAVAPLGGPYAVYELREMWTFVCAADRSIESGATSCSSLRVASTTAGAAAPRAVPLVRRRRNAPDRGAELLHGLALP